MSVSIIIPFYNAWHHTHQILFDLYLSHQGKHEIILVNDASTDYDVHTGLKWWKDVSDTLLEFKVANRKTNGGFGEAMNYGAARASGDILILLSNDVRIRPSVRLGDDVARILNNNPKTLVGGQIVDWKAGWNQFGDLVIPYLYGWLIACTKDAWNDLGGFDPIYAPYDYEDVDLCTNALLKGYNLTALNNSLLHHISGGTINKDAAASKRRLEHTQENRKKFENKWKSKFPELKSILERNENG